MDDSHRRHGSTSATIVTSSSLSVLVQTKEILLGHRGESPTSGAGITQTERKDLGVFGSVTEKCPPLPLLRDPLLGETSEVEHRVLVVTSSPDVSLLRSRPSWREYVSVTPS